MPRRPSIHFGASTSPHHSSHTVNEVVSAISRKLTSSHLENTSSSPSPLAARRSSFSMDSILHPKKEAKKEREGRRSDSKDRESNHHDKRHSMRSGSKAKTHSPRLAPVRPGRIEIIIESPPLLFIGNANISTGALLSGRVKFEVEDPSGEMTLESCDLVLRAVVNTKKPVSKDCDNCRTRYEELEKWQMIKQKKTYKKGQDSQIPFSHLLKGHIPASTSTALGSIRYELAAVARTTHGELIELNYPIVIQRAIPPGPDKSSIRIFPPTNLTGRVCLPPIVHPIGKFPVQMTLSGVVEKKTQTITRWRLRKMLWRVEEQCKMISAPCPKHLYKVSDGKAIQHSETKVIGNDEMKTGWKTDFDTAGGEIYLEFEAALTTKLSHKSVCDVDSAAGLQVNHTLIVELIVAEEFTPIKNPSIITPTGAARVLRMQFNIIVTERAGMGISWDEEMPPMYEDVPDSPPGYGSADRNDGAFGGAIMEDYNGPELEYVDLERMHTEDPNAPPTYRERDPATINQSLPMRTATPNPSEDVISGPSGTTRRLGAWTADELGAEPPNYRLRPREPSDTSQHEPEEDFGVGSAGEAAVERR